jgi:hypothetical protein
LLLKRGKIAQFFVTEKNVVSNSYYENFHRGPTCDRNKASVPFSQINGAYILIIVPIPLLVADLEAHPRSNQTFGQWL